MAFLLSHSDPSTACEQSWEPIEVEDNNDEDDDEQNENEPRNKYYPYIEQAERMAKLQLEGFMNDEDDNANQDTSKNGGFATTLFADFHQIYTYHTDLAEAIESEYIRFEPYLRQAVQTFMYDLHPELNDSNLNSNSNAGNGTGSESTTSMKNKFFIAMHNLPSLLPLRSLRTDTIGKLSSVSGSNPFN